MRYRDRTTSVQFRVNALEDVTMCGDDSALCMTQCTGTCWDDCPFLGETFSQSSLGEMYLHNDRLNLLS